VQVYIVDGQFDKDSSSGVVDPVVRVQFVDVAVNALETHLAKLSYEASRRIAAQPTGVLYRIRFLLVWCRVLEPARMQIQRRGRCFTVEGSYEDRNV